MLKIIFLDFDGPMNTGRQWYQKRNLNQPTEDQYGSLFDPDCVEQLERIIVATGAKIVVASSWKRIMSFQELLEMWEFRKLPGQIIDTTPNSPGQRGIEIDKWLKSLHESYEFIIIDDLDESSFKLEHQPYLLRVDPFWGITKEVADKAITILGKQETNTITIKSRLQNVENDIQQRLNGNITVPKIVTTPILDFERAKEKANVLIIPDVHGRPFWKEAVQMHPDLQVVFLGDYLDPYCNEYETIYMKEALENFEEIIEFKQTYPEYVTLLLGNHDIVYCDRALGCSRKNYRYESQIYLLLNANIKLFQLAYAFKNDKTDILMSHAGILKSWLDQYFPGYQGTSDSIAKEINMRCENFEELSDFIFHGLWEMSCIRGGLAPTGSPIWADISEHTIEERIGNIYQIIGHTQQRGSPRITNQYACLDCRRAFVLLEDGTIVSA